MADSETNLRHAVMALLLIMMAVGAYHRIRSQMSGESLDRTREGWPLLLGIRLVALGGFVAVITTLNGSLGAWAYVPIPVAIRWLGIAMLAASVAWLSWMFISLGRNLTDTVVTRKDAVFVQSGPYRFVRNPMYTGLLFAGLSLGVALANCLIALLFSLVFVLLALRTAREESYLIARFGDQYREYMTRVGRFFPHLFWFK